jgi:hypothetical protein
MDVSTRAPRTRYTSAAGQFSNPRVNFYHEESGIIFTVKGGRLDAKVPDGKGDVMAIGTKWIGDHAMNRQPTPSLHTCRVAAAKWLNENPELVAYYAAR